MAFCYHADHGNFAEVARLFTPAGTFDRFGHVLSGRRAIADRMSNRPEGIVARHGIVSVYFTIVDTTVAAAVVNSVTFYGFQTAGDTAELAPTSPRVVEFKDRYRLFEGEWLIEERVGTAVLVNPS